MNEQIGVQYQSLSKEIYAGRLNKSRTMFLNKQVVTQEVLQAVIEWALAKYDGEVALSNGATKLQIRVLTEADNDQH